MPVKVENLTHVYMKDTVFEHVAIDNISFEIQDGEFIGLIGHTGWEINAYTAFKRIIEAHQRQSVYRWRRAGLQGSTDEENQAEGGFGLPVSRISAF